MRRPSPSSSRTRASSEPRPSPAPARERWEVVRVWYHKLHSILPREALRVERTDGRTFASFEAAAAHARTLTIGGECSHAPMRVDPLP
jgi:hypothetical protein